ncbi:MAG: DsbA family oxidoreductase [Microthrixaceae bacterium]|nr:DsbA family oxidoreductase [Microthrixaceae bacterium]
MQLDVYSDMVCPWCYLGHRRLRMAIERLGGPAGSVELRWRAFQLDPAATSQPKDLRASIDRKYGPGAFDSMTPRLVELGAAEGIDFRFDHAVRVGTFDAHRLLQWTQATTPHRADALAERLFRAYFAEGANIADLDVLTRLSAEVGLDSDAAGDLLDGDGFAEVVRSDAADALDAGVTGVPAVVYDGAVVIPGAQDLDTMEAVVRRLLAKVGG